MFAKKILFVLVSLIISTTTLFHPSLAKAQGKDILPVLTVINPIRGSEWHGNKVNLLTSLKAQWQALQNEKVNATWLWQYTALEDNNLVSFAKENMKNQEFGLFLELDRNTVAKSGVVYRGQGPLYFSDGSFLVSYDLSERRKIIDTIFAKFKEKFGIYPKTVGAWWIGADSIDYMQKKYGIVAAMKAADQFNLDVYSIWGSPWSIPYLASKENEAIPADSFDKSSRVVILQWAARDPLNGYPDAMFSLQDFGIGGFGFTYPEYLSTIYLRGPLDNLNIGLENGETFSQYESYYKDKLSWAKKLEKDKKLDFMLVKDYADLFLSKNTIFASSDTKYFLSKDYKSDDQSFWYISKNFRTSIQKIGEKIYLVDLHDYSKKVNEDFSLLNNSQGYLRVSTPAVIDSLVFPDKKILLSQSKESLQLNKEGNDLILSSGKIKIARLNNTSLQILSGENSKIFEFSSFNKNENLKPIIFNKKQLTLYTIFPLISINYFVSSLKLLSVLFIFILFYFFILRSSSIIYKTLFYVFLIGAVLLFVKIPYFPLDRSTYIYVGILFCSVSLLIFVISLLILKNTKSKKIFVLFLAAIPLSILILAEIIYTSRTSIVITPFEMEALSVIKEKNKNVIIISETDYGIKPIYKAVKPLLYENYKYAEKITNTHWEMAKRPENNLIKLSNYDSMLIVVPRYLGTDFSDHEAQINGVKKIFDNGQIGIFEKE